MTISTEKPVKVFSEIGRLKQVILHRPGKELENLVPDYLERLLFDDIPFLKAAQKEHDEFAKLLENNDVEVLYLERLVAEAIEAADVREQFIDEWLAETDLVKGESYDAIRKDLLNYEDVFEMILKTMSGYRKTDIKLSETESLSDSIKTSYPFLVDPMPNLYFTRDPFATIGNGVALNHMYSSTRNRETLYGKYIFKYHPTFKNTDLYYNREWDTRLEGGDTLVLSSSTLALGISQRTDARSIERLAKIIFEKTDFKEILAFLIADNRKFMHLDTVFTMVDYDKFTIHPEIEGDLKVFSITAENETIHIEEKVDTLENILEDALHVDHVQLIRCGGGDLVEAAREQWNDGSNTLTIAPGEVIVYDRNTVTNQMLREAGIKVHEFGGSELVRGRGGPRCMSMPVYREDI
ncbi:arginine deiminase [Marinilactibacillus psychrotolerans]|uniref:arginine deiminase n=1 Tax=Marinilactibacillus psychrotolerans TaxID=191770 RepID=UPI0039B06FF9